jgi:hypothetical protein
MPDQPVSHDFGYVHTDIPAGMTIREWRDHRAAERAAERGTARAERRIRSLARRAALGVIHMWLHARRPRHHRTAREVHA